MERDELQALYDEALDELAELGEVWLEFRVMRRPTDQVDAAIAEVTRESRRYERKLRKLAGRVSAVRCAGDTPESS